MGRLIAVGKGHPLRLAACVPAATLPNVPDMNWQNVMRPAAGECSRIRGKFAGWCHAWGGGIRSRRVAGCRRGTPLVAPPRLAPWHRLGPLPGGARPGAKYLEPHRRAQSAPRGLGPGHLGAQPRPPVGRRHRRLRRRSRRPLQPSARCPRFRSSLRRPSPVSASTAARCRRWCRRSPPRTSRASIPLTWSRPSCSAFPASPPTTSRATNSPRTYYYATAASRLRRCRALQRHRIRCLGRLLRPRRRLPAVRVRNGEWGLYLAAEGLKDDGWRLLVKPAIIEIALDGPMVGHGVAAVQRDQRRFVLGGLRPGVNGAIVVGEQFDRRRSDHAEEIVCCRRDQMVLGIGAFPAEIAVEARKPRCRLVA